MTNKQYYGDRRNIRQAFRETCFVHYAAGYTTPPWKTRHVYLMNLVLCYGIVCVKRNIGRIKAAMDEAELVAKCDADLVAIWAARKK